MNDRYVPKKFQGVKKSFMEKLEGSVGDRVFATFCAFPNKVSFNGKDEKEEVILVIRRDLASLLPQIGFVIAFLLAPLAVIATLSALGVEGTAAIQFGLGGSLIFVLIGIAAAFDTFLKWFYSINIITDERIVDVDFSNVLYHRFSEAQLEQVQDVTHKVSGILGSIFDYGSVYIQTAGTNRELEFVNVPRPRDIQDVLLDLLEMKQKGDI